MAFSPNRIIGGRGIVIRTSRIGNLKPAGGGVTERLKFLMQGSDALYETKSDLVSQGYRIRPNVDFRKFKKIMVKLGKPLTEPFDPDHNDFTPATGFYLTVTCPKGKTVATVAFRLFQLGGLSLDQYLITSWSRLFSYRSETPAKLSKRQVPLFQSITEDTIYGGEMFVHREHRDQGIAEALAHYGLIYAYMYWPTARHLFALMLKSSGSKGLGLDHGFKLHEEMGIRWKHPPTSYPYNLVVAYSSLSDIETLIEVLLDPRRGEISHPRIEES